VAVLGEHRISPQKDERHKRVGGKTYEAVEAEALRQGVIVGLIKGCLEAEESSPPRTS
jgi:hypothetical protein